MSSFLLNKYTRWYNTIIEHRQSNLAEGYTERHHIVPKSLGGSNDASNLVALTAREHFVCHRLLTKMIAGDNRIKMLRALNAFSINSKKNPRNLTSRQYAIARAAYVPRTGYSHSPETRDKISKANTGYIQTAEANARRSATLTGRPAHNKGQSMPFKGRVSPTKGMKFDYTPMPRGTCPYCGKEMGTNNLARHIKRHDAYKS
jgi:HNH endonuclease/NUMOD3 motif